MRLRSRQGIPSRAIALGAACYAILAGALTLVGWGWSIPRLTDWIGNGLVQPPGSALASILGGAALASSLIRRPSWSAARVLPALLLCVLALGAFPRGFSAVPPASVSDLSSWISGLLLLSAGGYLLLSLGLLLLGWRARRGARRAASGLALCTLFLAAVQPVGLLFATDFGLGIASLARLPIQSTTSLLALSLGLLEATSARGMLAALRGRSPRALLLRRMLAPILLLPLLAAWIGLQGTRQGWYDAAFGSALLALVVIAVLLASLLWSARRAGIAAEALARHDRLRHDAEEETDHQRRFLAAVLESLPVGVAIADPGGRIVSVNRSLAEIWGASPETPDWRAYGDWVGYWPRSGERLAAHEWAMARALLRGERVHDELVEIERFGSGERRFILNNAAPVLDAGGRPLGAVVAELDVTARLEAERTLREAAERYLLVHRATNDVIWDWDLHGGEILWNEMLSQLFGHDRTASTIAWWEELVHPDDRERVVTGIRAAIDGGESSWRDEYRFRRGDGRYATVIDRGHIQREGGHPVRMIGSMLDLTERLAAERALRESEARFRSMAENVPALVWMSDADGRVEFVNRGYLDFSGRDPPPPGQDPWNGMVPAEDAAELERLRRAAAGGERFEGEMRLRRADGALRWMRTLGVPRADEDGRLRGYLVLALDTHERRLAQEALAEADRRKDEFLAMLGHELRNPLAPIRTAGELIQRLAPQDSRVARAGGIIDRQTAQLARLVDDLLEVARISRGKLELDLRPMRLDAALHRALEMTLPLIEARKQRLEVSIPDPPLRVRGDLTRLAQVFGNLLDNAAKFTPEGGRIELVAEAAGERARVRLSDSGMGIRQEMLGAIFDLFVQAHATLGRKEGGLGLGLTLTQRLVQMHGGTIVARSAGPGAGSTFVVELPLDPGASLPDAHPRGAAGAAGRLRVLVVDDNVDAAASMALLLDLAGHEVRTANDGESALAIAAEWPPRVVVLDIGLPGMSGYDVARHLRHREATASALLIAVTGYGRPEDLFRARAAGFDHHLLKPVGRDALLESVERWVMPEA